MGQPAYDMSSEVRRRKAPQTQRKVALRVEKGGKRRLSPFQAAMQHTLQLISMALLAGFAVSCGARPSWWRSTTRSRRPKRNS